MRSNFDTNIQSDYECNDCASLERENKRLRESAAQSVAEFKERLKEAIRYDLTISMGNADKFITLIDETK